MRTIALEEHFLTAELAGPPSAAGSQPWHPSMREVLLDLGKGRLADMDAAGIDVQVISHVAPAAQQLGGAGAVQAARRANDQLAAAIASHPGRLAGFATLPTGDPAAAADELERAVGGLGFVGALVNSTLGTNGAFLDDARFEPLLARFEQLDVPLYLHPAPPPPQLREILFGGLPEPLAGRLATAAWGWHAEAGLHALRMVTAGVFDRHPGLRMIVGHCGEMIPFMLDRIDRILHGLTGLALSPSEYFLRNLWVTTAGMFSLPPVMCAVQVLGVDRVLFSVDYPFGSNQAGRRLLDTLPLSPADRAKIAGGNAERVLRLTPLHDRADLMDPFAVGPAPHVLADRDDRAAPAADHACGMRLVVVTPGACRAVPHRPPHPRQRLNASPVFGIRRRSEATSRLGRLASIDMFNQLRGATRLYPIIGDPVKYAESPARLTRTFGDRGHNGVCIPMQVREGDLAVVMAALSVTVNVDGVLVTMPHKFTAFTQCATSSERARLLGAVSVIRRNPDGSWHGDMLDGLAFVKAQRDHGAHVAGARALLVGAGGAGSAIAIALLEAGVRELVVHDADDSRVAAILGLLAGPGDGRVVAGAADPADCDLVFNATPMGMEAGDPLPVDAALLTSSMFVGDVIAGHDVTPFIRAAQATGCKTADGGHMVEAVQDLMADFMLGG